MEDEGSDSLLKRINEKTRRVRESRFSIPIYILTIFAASIWLIFFNPCLMYIILPIMAILIPYKLYDENSFKKLLVVGVVAVILLGFSMSGYYTFIFFNQPAREVHSREIMDERIIKNGTIDRIYGDSQTEFNLTVEVRTDVIENYYDVDVTDIDNDITANITYYGVVGLVGREYETYNMTRVNESSVGKGAVKYYATVTGLEESIFQHHFSLKTNMTEEDPWEKWEETEPGFGPVTLDEPFVLGIITLQESFNISIFFFLGMGILWLKKRMDKSIVESTEGLEEKEEELEDHCPDCGHLLEGKKECDRCGWIKEEDDEMYDDEGEPD